MAVTVNGGAPSAPQIAEFQSVFQVLPTSHSGAGGAVHANVVAAGASGFMTGADKTKLDGVATGATANSADATLLDRANHTGTQAQSTITNLTTDLAAKAPLANPTFTGTVTLPDATVANAKLANMATATFKGRATAGTGDPEDLTATQVRTLLNVANGATANSSDATLLARANHTGTQTASTISDFNSATRAQVEAELIAGTNVTITPGGSGATRTLTIASSGGSGVADGDKGDITVSASGATWTIDNDVVTNAKAANMATATIKGRATAGTGDPEDLTATQATALLNTFTTSLKGLAPASGGGTTNYLRADGTWAAPAGGGSVTSVGMSVPTGLSVSGSPITGAGTLAVTLAAGYVIPTQTALDDKLSSSAATTISATKAVLVAADKLISFDSAASDAPKLTTLGELNNSLGRLAPGTGLGTTGTVNLDLAALAGTDQQITATGNITITTSNRAAGLRGRLRIAAGGSTRTLTWPSWTAFGAALPTSLASGKVLRVAWECTGTTDASIDAVAVESA